MAASEVLTTRNKDFAAHRFTTGLRMMRSLKAIVIGCVDPRVDPTALLGAEPGEIAAIRNVGGRVTPGVRREVAMLRRVTLAAGGDLGLGWELIVLHHTDCGITHLVDQPELLAAFFEVDKSRLGDLAVTDPRVAVAVDVAALRAETSDPTWTNAKATVLNPLSLPEDPDELLAQHAETLDRAYRDFASGMADNAAVSIDDDGRLHVERLVARPDRRA